MDTKQTILTALRALLIHKSRSLLTILGIVIGVAAIIIVMALGSGAQSLILNQISGLGAESLVVRPGKSVSDFNNVLFSQTITHKDYEALTRKSNVPHLRSLTPFVFIGDPVEYRGDVYRPTTLGASVEFVANVFDIRPSNGSFYTQDDIDNYARVAVIGAEIKDEIFENQLAVGDTIRIKDQRFRVVGVFAPKGTVGGLDFNNMVMIPYTTAQRYVTGTDYYNQIVLKADSPENIEKMVFDVKATLRDTHNIKIGDEDDFNVQTQQNLISQIELITDILTAFLAAVVAISLVVGGIGIMNIMLVSVTERTKEIGLRKAVGARRQDILRQFLYEAVTLTVVGGIVGVLLGVLVSLLIAIVLQKTIAEGWNFVFPVGAVVLGVLVSAGIGLLFGIYPANQAAKKSPIEALQYE